MRSQDYLAYLAAAAGFLLAVLIIWILHVIGRHAPEPSGPRETRDRIWLLEKWFLGIAVGILLLAHLRELEAIFKGNATSDNLPRDLWLVTKGFAGSVIVMLVAKFADFLLGHD
jgi:hypothetical protein